MEAQYRLVVAVADKFIEFGVFLVLDLAFRARPDGFNGIDFFALDLDRKGDEGRILLDNPRNGEFQGVFFRIFLQLHNDLGAAMQAVAGADRVGAVADKFKLFSVNT